MRSVARADRDGTSLTSGNVRQHDKIPNCSKLTHRFCDHQQVTVLYCTRHVLFLRSITGRYWYGTVGRHPLLWVAAISLQWSIECKGYSRTCKYRPYLPYLQLVLCKPIIPFFLKKCATVAVRYRLHDSSNGV